MERKYLLSDFDFHLPDKLLATVPLEPRDASRLMIIHKSTGHIAHRMFRDLPTILKSGDRLIFNDTKVVPARLQARKDRFAKGALLDILLLGTTAENPSVWTMLVDPVRKVGMGTRLIFGENELFGEIVSVDRNREVGVKFWTDLSAGELRNRLYTLGEVPLPPYLKRARGVVSLDRYQTVYAQRDGALAAPTAGLHFTDALLHSLESSGIARDSLTLQVGLGTFDALFEEDFSQTKLHKEWFEIPDITAAHIRESRSKGDQVISIGTTSLRALESSIDADGEVQAAQGFTDIFIRPGHTFQSVDGLLTNFHTPRSSLLILIASFMGYELMKAAYREAVEQEYRFYSFGDAMLILP